MIFDGIPPIEKQAEHTRRQNDPNSIRITSDYIAMCIQVCKSRCIPYIVAPAEADMQVGRRHNNSIVLRRDSDEVAYGNEFVVIVDSYAKEEYRIIDLSTHLTDEVMERYPLYYFYRKFGFVVFHYWAACMGCDISRDKSGMIGIGRMCFLKALREFECDNPPQFSALAFARNLRKHGDIQTRTKYSPTAITDELERVSAWFSRGGTYYDEAANVLSVAGEIVKSSSRITKEHMAGSRDPKTSSLYTNDQKIKINSVQSHNLLHNSATDKSKLNGLSLPDGKTLDECTVDELKRMVIVRGGSLQGDGKNLTKDKLKRFVKAYLLMERERSKHTVYFDRCGTNNGVFDKIDTSERRTIGQILTSLKHPEAAMLKFFNDVKELYDGGDFEDNFTTIALSAPEMRDDFIQKAFIHVGESETQKNIRMSLQQVMQMKEVIYHAIAESKDGKSLYILSKQRASQKHDEKTRNKTEHGEQAKFAEYLVILQLSVEKTTVRSHGHDLGVFMHVMRSYCASCKAGCGMCYHRAGALHMQHHHWGEGRPTERPATAGWCPWIPGCRNERVCTTLKPASHTHIEQLPGSNDEAKKKAERGVKKNMHTGIPTRYDVFGGDTRLREMLNDPRYVSLERWQNAFNLIRKLNR